MRPQRGLIGAALCFYSFAAKWKKRSKALAQNRRCYMYNNYLSCEMCKTELTRSNQKQKIDSEGYMHSYCEKCYSEKFGKR